MVKINFNNSILDNPNWDKISEVIIKTFLTWNRLRLSLRGNKMIANEVLLSKLWYIDEIYTLPKYLKQETEIIYNFLYNGKKYDLSGT